MQNYRFHQTEQWSISNPDTPVLTHSLCLGVQLKPP